MHKYVSDLFGERYFSWLFQNDSFFIFIIIIKIYNKFKFLKN